MLRNTYRRDSGELKNGMLLKALKKDDRNETATEGNKSYTGQFTLALAAFGCCRPVGRQLADHSSLKEDFETERIEMF